MIYVDTSALVPYYCPEALSDAAQRFLASQNELAISDLEEVELFSALAKKVRAGEMGRKDAQRVRAGPPSRSTWNRDCTFAFPWSDGTSPPHGNG